MDISSKVGIGDQALHTDCCILEHLFRKQTYLRKIALVPTNQYHFLSNLFTVHHIYILYVYFSKRAKH